jgi:tetratricopeptide (TPR) repeat protein
VDTANDALDRGLDDLHQGRYGAATRTFLEAARRAPDDPEPHLLIAFTAWWRLQLDDGDRDQLRERVDAALERVLDLGNTLLDADEADVRALTMMGSAYILRAHVDAGRKKYFRAARAARRGKKSLERALRTDPDQVDARFTLGAYNYYADKVPAIVKGLRAILFLPGGNSERGLADLRLVSNSQGRFRTDARLLLALIQGSAEERCYAAALEHLEVALMENENSPLIIALIGKLHMNLGDYGRAREAFELALKATEDEDADRVRQRQELRVSLAGALVGDWRLKEAEAILRDGVFDMQGASRAPLKHLARVRYEIATKQGTDGSRDSKAARGRSRALEDALTAFADGRTGEAIVRLGRTQDLYPQSPVVTFLKGRMLYLEGSDQEAIREFSALRRADGDPPRWMRGWTELYLGLALERSGENRAARAHFKRASKIKRFGAADRALLELSGGMDGAAPEHCAP